MDYKGHYIDDYIPDIEFPNRLIIELKTVDQIIDEHIGQVINYLKISGISAGLIFNFAHPKLQWKKLSYPNNTNHYPIFFFIYIFENRSKIICVHSRSFAVVKWVRKKRVSALPSRVGSLVE